MASASLRGHTIGWLRRLSRTQHREGIALPFLLITLMATGLAGPTNTIAQDQPNVLLIVAEDMSNRVGSFGDPIAQTPSIDALAREGVRFTQTFGVAGVCAPNRSALITGVYPQSMGTQHMRTSTLKYEAVPPAPVKAFPELLRAAGYVTANTSKTDYQFGEPFSVWDVNEGGFVDPPNLAVWRRLAPNKPFFAMINLMSTHESQLVTSQTKAKGQFGKFVQQMARARTARVEAVTAPDTVAVPPYYPDTPAVRASIAQHYDNIHYMDAQVQQIIGHLKEDGLLHSTIVIWTTDHGDGLPRAKRSIYDSGLHVPMVIRFPNQHRAGTEDARLVSVIDLAPTILRMTGTRVPPFIQGRDFLQDPPRGYVHAGRDRMDEVHDWVRAVRDKRFKYVRNYVPEASYFRPLAFRDMFPVMQSLWANLQTQSLNDTQQFYFTAPRPQEELYDTQTDPHEVVNLAGEEGHHNTLVRLREEMNHWLAAVGDQSRVEERESISAMWPDEQQPSTDDPSIHIEAGLVAIRSATPGASIGYRRQGETEAAWTLYSGPFTKPRGDWLEAKAIRYGYKESEVVRLPLSEVQN